MPDAQPARYVLGHGWRYSIFLTIIIIYAYIFMRVCYRVRSRRLTNSTTPHNAEADPPLPFSPNVQRFDVKRTDGLQSLESGLPLNVPPLASPWARTGCGCMVC